MPDVETITQQDLVAIVEVALANPIRTTGQQDALVRVCRQLDNPFVSWSTTAGETWEGGRCSCGRAIPVMADTCGDCRRAEPAQWVVTCSDGVVRHDPFDSRAEAQQWAEWGHICESIVHHTIDQAAR